MPACDVEIVRTWKRDGSCNVMSLDAAAHNLHANGKDQFAEDGVENRRGIRTALLRGHRLETALAVFSAWA